jgi:hypothetical protein
MLFLHLLRICLKKEKELDESTYSDLPAVAEFVNTRYST